MRWNLTYLKLEEVKDDTKEKRYPWSPHVHAVLLLIIAVCTISHLCDSRGPVTKPHGMRTAGDVWTASTTASSRLTPMKEL